MRRACATAGLAALHGNRRAQMRECTGLDTKRPLEMHYGPGKEPCQGDKFWLDPRNAGVMRIKSRIVVNVDARKRPPGRGVVEHPSCHARRGDTWRQRTWPDPVVVRLAKQGAQIGCRRSDIA